MARTAAEDKAIRKYDEKFERLNIRIPAGELEKIKQYAADQGMSLAAYVYGLIQKDMDK